MNKRNLIETILSSQIEEVLNDFIIQNYSKIKQIHFDDYLVNLHINEIANSTKDFDWENIKIKYIYAIDNFDISEFCFPLGLKSNSKESINFDRVTDEQIAWNQFLLSVNSNNIYNLENAIFMFDEHAHELDKLHKIVLESNKITNSFNYFLENFLFKNEDSRKNINQKELNTIHAHLPFLISLLLGFGENKILDFITILKKTICKKSDFNKFHEYKNDVETFYEGFQNAQADIPYVINTLFPEAKRLKAFKNFDQEDFEKKDTRNYNVLMDCYVLDRTIKINDFFSKKETIETLGNTRYILKLLSSTSVTKEISYESKILNGKWPKIGNLEVKIPINSEMLYFDLLINSEKIDEEIYLKDKIIQLVNYLYASNLSKFSTKKLHGKTKDKIIELRSQVKSTSMFVIALENKEEISEKLNIILPKLGQNQDLLEAYELLKNLSLGKGITMKEATQQAIQDSKNFKVYHSCVTIIDEGWNYVNNFRPYRSETDKVIGLNHIYPILLRSFDNEDMIEIVNKLRDILIGSNYGGEYLNKSVEFKRLFVKINDGSFKSDFLNQFQSRLILHFLVMFLYPFPFLTKNRKKASYHEQKNELRLELISEVNNDISILENLLEQNFGNKKIQLESLKIYDFYKDIVYFQINALRYFGKFKDSLLLGKRFFEKAKKINFIEDENSPRINHALFLTYYCKIVETKDASINKTKFNDYSERINSHYFKAIKGYEKNYPYLSEIFLSENRNLSKTNKFDYGRVNIQGRDFPIVLFSYFSLRNAFIFYNLLLLDKEIINIKEHYNQFLTYGNDLMRLKSHLEELDLGINGFTEYSLVFSFYKYMNYKFTNDSNSLLEATKGIERCMEIEEYNYELNDEDPTLSILKVFKKKIDFELQNLKK